MFVLRIVERDSLRRHLRWRERVARLGRVYGSGPMPLDRRRSRSH